MGIGKAEEPVIDAFFNNLNIGMIANHQMKVRILYICYLCKYFI